MRSPMQNHFELFGLPVSFEIEMSALDTAYRKIQSQVHPDKYASGTDTEKRIAMQWTTRANEAYLTLKKPLKRAVYLCELNGVDIAAESNTSMPPAFLMQQMEWRESLDDLKSGVNPSGLQLLEQEVLSSLKQTIRDIQNACDSNDFHTVAGLIRMSMFMEKFLNDIASLDD